MNKRGYRDAMRGVDNERIGQAINAYVHSQRDREVLRLSLIHGISYMRISERPGLEISPRTVQEIMNRWMPVLLEHL